MYSCLRNSTIMIEFDNTTGLPNKHKIRKGAVFTGELWGKTVLARVCCLVPRTYIDISVKPVKIVQGMSEISFQYEAYFLQNINI